MTDKKTVPLHAIISGLLPVTALTIAFAFTLATCNKGSAPAPVPTEPETPKTLSAPAPQVYENKTPKILPVIPQDKLFKPKTVVWEDEEGSKFIVTLINAIAYGGGKYVAVSDDSNIAYSEDGITWTAIPPGKDEGTTRFGSSNNVQGIAWGNGRFVAVGFSGIAAYSDDGVTWTNVQIPILGTSNGCIYGIAYGNGKFVAVGYTEIYKRGAIAYSTDGITFTYVPQLPGEFGKFIIKAVAYGSGKFVAGDNYGRMAYSADGITWTEVTDNSAWLVNNGWEPPYNTASINSIAYGNNMFVATGNHIKLVTSADGVTWTIIETGIFDIEEDYFIFPAAYYNNMFLIGGWNVKKMAYSADGITWRQIPRGDGKN
jgi:hypothetical protein